MTDDERLAAEAAREEQERTAKRRGRWGCLVWIALLVALPALIVTAVGTVLVVVDRQAELEALERTREAGDPVTPAEVRELYGATPESAAATERWMAVLAAVRLVVGDPSSMKMPILGMRDSEPTLDDRGLYDEATVERVEPFLSGPAQDALAKAHAARDSARDVRYPFAFESSFAFDSVQVQELRGAANLLALEAQTRTARGEVREATDSLLTLIAASETLAEAPDIIAFLIRLAILGVAVDNAMNLIDRHDFPPEDLKRLQEAFARQTFHREMLRAVKGDQVQCLVRFGENLSTLRGGQTEFVEWYPLRGEDRAMTLSLYRDFLDAAAEGLPAADRAADRVQTRVDGLSDSQVEAVRYAFTLNLVPSFEAIVNASFRVQAQTRMAEACCACERYRQEHGAYPPTLAALVPDYLSAVPLDPVDDQPLRYEVDGERMIIHSVAHFRPENDPDGRTLEDGLASHILGERYVPEPAGDAAENGQE